jgi:hypothetical protein
MLPGSDRIVFISFVPGSFGSFLLHCLSYSPSVYHRNTGNLYFDDNGACHYNITDFFTDFHSGQSIAKWFSLTTDKRNEFLVDNWKPTKEFVDSNLYYIHRSVLPKFTRLLKSHIPEAKYIKITIPEKYNDVVVDMIIRKDTTSKPKKSYINLKNNKVIDGVYDFDISHFIEGTFLEEFNKLCEWLNFEKVDVSIPYEEFKRVNNLA